ncbi:MAG: single-stranded DNA-binding protein, partial [Sphaerochaeta sp.]
MKELAEAMVQRTLQLREQVESLRFSTDYIIYNPLLYAWDVHEQYIRKYMSAPIEALFLGMNPGPFGMAQTGVPFGEITSVKTFLKLEGEIGKPPYEHPARPILGLNVKRSEVSGKRLWALFCEHYADSTSCFSQIAV